MYNNAFKNLIKLFCLDNTINDKVQETDEVMDIDGVEETKMTLYRLKIKTVMNRLTRYHMQLKFINIKNIK